MPADPIRALIDMLARSGAPPVRIEHEVDAKQPCRILYRITGGTREAVQRPIDELTNKVADGFGYATFDGPKRTSTGWTAIGQVVVYEAADAS